LDSLPKLFFIPPIWSEKIKYFLMKG